MATRQDIYNLNIAVDVKPIKNALVSLEKLENTVNKLKKVNLKFTVDTSVISDLKKVSSDIQTYFDKNPIEIKINSNSNALSPLQNVVGVFRDQLSQAKKEVDLLDLSIEKLGSKGGISNISKSEAIRIIDVFRTKFPEASEDVLKFEDSLTKFTTMLSEVNNVTGLTTTQVANIFAKGLGKDAVNIVRDANNKIDKSFEDLYIAVVGNSWIPDLVTESIEWLNKLGKDGLNGVKKLYTGIQNYTDLSLDAIVDLSEKSANAFENLENTTPNIVKGIKDKVIVPLDEVDAKISQLMGLKPPQRTRTNETASISSLGDTFVPDNEVLQKALQKASTQIDKHVLKAQKAYGRLSDDIDQAVISMSLDNAKFNPLDPESFIPKETVISIEKNAKAINQARKDALSSGEILPKGLNENLELAFVDIQKDFERKIGVLTTSVKNQYNIFKEDAFRGNRIDGPLRDLNRQFRNTGEIADLSGAGVQRFSNKLTDISEGLALVGAGGDKLVGIRTALFGLEESSSVAAKGFDVVAGSINGVRGIIGSFTDDTTKAEKAQQKLADKSQEVAARVADFSDGLTGQVKVLKKAAKEQGIQVQDLSSIDVQIQRVTKAFKDMETTIAAGGVPTTRQISRIEIESRQLENRFKALDQLEISDPGFNQLLARLKKDSQAFNRSNQFLQASLEASTKEVEKAKEEQEKYGTELKKSGNIFTRMVGKLNIFKKGNQEIGQSSSQMRKYSSSVSNVNEELSHMELLLKALPLAIGNIIGKVIDPISLMENSFIGVANRIDESRRIAEAALSLTAEQAQIYEASIINIYNTGVGENVEQVSDALLFTIQRFRDLGVTATDELEDITETALKMSKVFKINETDIIDASQAISKNFNVSGKEAQDILTGLLQRGVIGPDVIDSFTEYSTQIRSLGGDLDDLVNLAITGFQGGGVLGLDKAFDQLKEFRLRLRGEDKAFVDALKKLDINTQQFFQDVSNGSVTPIDAYEGIRKKLLELDNEQLRAKIGFDLLGTQFEDLGDQAGLAISSIGISAEDLRGSTEKLDVAYESIGQAFEVFSRKLTTGMRPLRDLLLNIVNQVMPIVLNALQTMQPYIDALVARFNNLIDAFGNQDWESAGNYILSIIADLIENASIMFLNIISYASSWGNDLMLTFANGIIDAGVQYISQAMEYIGSLIDSYMPHSDAKKGPLSNITVWGTSFSETFGKGIIDSDISGFVEQALDPVETLFADKLGTNGFEAFKEFESNYTDILGNIKKTGNLDKNALSTLLDGVPDLNDDLRTRLELQAEYKEALLQQEKVEFDPNASADEKQIARDRVKNLADQLEFQSKVEKENDNSKVKLALKTANRVAGATKARVRKEVDFLKNGYEQQKALLESNFKDGIISRDEYLRGIVKLEKKYIDESKEQGILSGLDEHIIALKDAQAELESLGGSRKKLIPDGQDLITADQLDITSKIENAKVELEQSGKELGTTFNDGLSSGIEESREDSKTRINNSLNSLFGGIETNLQGRLQAKLTLFETIIDTTFTRLGVNYDALKEKLKIGGGIFASFGTTLGTIASTSTTFRTQLLNIVTSIGSFTTKLLAANPTTNKFLGIFTAITTKVLPNLGTILPRIVSVFGRLNIFILAAQGLFYGVRSNIDQLIDTGGSLGVEFGDIFDRLIRAIEPFGNIVLYIFGFGDESSVPNLVVNAMNKISEVVNTVLPPIQKIFSGVFSVISGIIRLVVIPAMNAIIGVIALLSGDTELFKESFQAAWESIKAGTTEIIDGLLVSIEGLLDGIVQLGSGIIETMSGIVRDIVASVFGEDSEITKNVSRAANNLSEFFNQAKQKVSIILGQLFAIVRYYGTLAFSKLTEAWNSFTSALQNLNVSEIFNNIVTAIRNLWTQAKSIFTLLKTTIYNRVKGIYDDVIGFFTDLYNDLIGNSIIPDMISDIITALTSFQLDFQEIFQSLLPHNILLTLYNFGKSLVASLLNGINIESALDSMKNLFNPISEFFNTLSFEDIKSRINDLLSFENFNLAEIFKLPEDFSFNSILDKFDIMASSFGLKLIELSQGYTEIISSIFGIDLTQYSTTALSDKLTEVQTTMDNVKQNILNSISSLGQSLGLDLIGIYNGFTNTFQTIINEIPNKFDGLKDTLTTKLVGVGLGLLTSASTLLLPVTSTIESFKTDTIQFFQDIADSPDTIFAEFGTNLANRFKDVYDKAIEWFEKLYNDLVGNSIIPDMRNDVAEEVKGMASDFIGSIAGLATDLIDVYLPKFTSFGSNLIGNVTSGIESAKNKFKETVGSVLDTVSNISIGGLFGSGGEEVEVVEIDEKIASQFNNLESKFISLQTLLPEINELLAALITNAGLSLLTLNEGDLGNFVNNFNLVNDKIIELTLITLPAFDELFLLSTAQFKLETQLENDLLMQKNENINTISSSMESLAQRAKTSTEKMVKGILKTNQALVRMIKYLSRAIKLARELGEAKNTNSGSGVVGQATQGFAVGAWNLSQDQIAMVHKGETILPTKVAQDFRNFVTSLRSVPIGNRNFNGLNLATAGTKNSGNISTGSNVNYNNIVFPNARNNLDIPYLADKIIDNINKRRQ